MTREEWLNKLAGALRPLFQSHGKPLPAALRISCGWPTRRALAANGKSRTIGQCFSAECSSDGSTEVFVSPAIADAGQVAGVLAHELVHAALNCDGGHGKPFRQLASRLGLTGKMTATQPSQELAERLNALSERIGPYPHATLDYSTQPKQSTRLIKIQCPECGYTARTTRQWIAKGLPTCPCGQDMEEDA